LQLESQLPHFQYAFGDVSVFTSFRSQNKYKTHSIRLCASHFDCEQLRIETAGRIETEGRIGVAVISPLSCKTNKK